MTLEAWVRPSLANTVFQTVLMKEQTGNLIYALYSNTDTSRPDTEDIIGGAARVLSGPSALPTGAWSYLTATYDGSTLRLYLNGTQIAQTAVSGALSTSTGALRIGGNGVWGEWFNGWIDEVRVYNRALNASEIQNDMFTSVTPDTTPPAIVSKSPAGGSAGINVGTPVTATFSEFMRRQHDLELELRVEGFVQQRRSGERHLRLDDEHRDPDPAGGSPVREDVHRHGQGWQRWRHGLRGQRDGE